jgi:hypothetical protein
MRRHILLMGLLSACGGGGNLVRPYPPPTTATLLGHLTSLRERATALNAETLTDVRLASDRVNVQVDMLAVWGGKLRFQAYDPNHAMAADLASDGKTYCLIDVHANCAECGPATPDTVARLVRIPLEPDQVVAVLLGGAPVIPGDATDEWNANDGTEVVTVHGRGQTERLVLDGREQRWDLLRAELIVEGTTQWTVRHKDFHAVTSASGQTVRLPGASLFEQGGDTVRIEWRDQRVGEVPAEGAFHLTTPPGLPACGQRRSAR